MNLRLLVDYIATRLGREEGATAVEYGLMVALIAVVVIGGATLLGTATEGKFQTAGAAITAN